MLFRVIGGDHYVGSKQYKKGDLIESNTDLCKVFRNKFEKVADIIHEDEIKPVLRRNKKVDYGEDVSESFSITQEVEDVKIFKSGTKFYVFSAENLKTPLNKKPLKKNEINAYVNRMIEDESVEEATEEEGETNG